MTTVEGLPLNEKEMKAVAKKLKQKCEFFVISSMRCALDRDGQTGSVNRSVG